MSKDQVQEIIGKGKTAVFTLDPDYKNELVRKQLDTVVREAKSHLAIKKRVHLVMVKE